MKETQVILGFQGNKTAYRSRIKQTLPARHKLRPPRMRDLQAPWGKLLEDSSLGWSLAEKGRK